MSKEENELMDRLLRDNRCDEAIESCEPRELLQPKTEDLRQRQFLEQKQLEDKKIKTSPLPDILHNCAPFIVKLYSLVNADEYAHLVRRVG